MEANQNQGGPGGLVLVVEDNQPVALALVKVLENAGYRAIAFEKGREAFDYAKAHRPTAAIIDVHLPDVNGLVLTRELREMLGPRTPLIVLSGDTSMEVISGLQHSNATHFLAKPIRGSVLVERLREWIREGMNDVSSTG